MDKLDLFLTIFETLETVHSPNTSERVRKVLAALRAADQERRKDQIAQAEAEAKAREEAKAKEKAEANAKAAQEAKSLLESVGTI